MKSTRQLLVEATGGAHAEYLSFSEVVALDVKAAETMFNQLEATIADEFGHDERFFFMSDDGRIAWGDNESIEEIWDNGQWVQVEN